jgi:CMP/dCMP kinase
VSAGLPLTPAFSPQAGRGSEERRERPAPHGFARSAARGQAPAREGEGRQSFVVAIDGPSASGKGTLARRLADHFGLAYLDTGTLYRATALLILDHGGDASDPATAEAAARRVNPRILSEPRLRRPAVAATASIVAAIPAVRNALLDLQRQFAARPPRPARGAVLDGRDIGSVVCPSADAKLFLTASAEVRARRRLAELRQQGTAAIYEIVLQEMKERDARDSKRRVAPLIASPDAVVIDTTTLDADAVFERACDLIQRSLKEK